MQSFIERMIKNWLYSIFPRLPKKCAEMLEKNHVLQTPEELNQLVYDDMSADFRAAINEVYKENGKEKE